MRSRLLAPVVVAAFFPWAEARGGTLKRGPQVVYVSLQGAGGTYAAKKITSAVFRNAGVTIVWGATGLRVELGEHTPGEWMPGALAASYPYDNGSKHITVFLDRIRALARGDGLDSAQLAELRQSALLGYVLAHEITHVLEGTDRHSSAGLMKARWDARDRAAIFEGRLGFLQEDVALIRRGLARNGDQPEPALIARSQSGTALHPE